MKAFILAVLTAAFLSQHSQAEPEAIRLTPSNNGEYTVLALLEGKCAATLLVDTGASDLFLTERAARTLGLDRREPAGHRMILTPSGLVHCKFYQVESVEIGNVRRGPMMVYVHPFPKSFLTDGLLGRSFFRGKPLMMRAE